MRFMTGQVFVNFLGPEMRKGFASHLLHSFNTQKMKTFIASEPFEDVDHEAMEQSLVAIPVISKDYVNSYLWVNDLSKIIECDKIGILKAIPIFFQVNPLDIIRDGAGNYPNVKNESLEMVSKWLCAQVSRKSSFHSSDWFTSNTGTNWWGSFPLSSARLRVFCHETSNLPLLDLKGALEKLHAFMHRAEYRVIGICGIQGIGKTTLAKNLFDEISPRFQHHYYLDNFSKFQYPPSLREMLDLKESSFHGSSDEAIKEMIGHRKVLLVVDGVDVSLYLKCLMMYASWFGPGSRVIVITHERSLLTMCGVKDIYEVECPRYEEALAFFSEFAFKRRNPLPGFEDLSFRAVHVANRLPLALKVLGSFLHDRDKDEWVSTLRRLEASHDDYASEVSRYIGADDYAPRRPIKVDRHIGVDEANRIPLYCLAFE